MTCKCGHEKSQHPNKVCDYKGYSCQCSGYTPAIKLPTKRMYCAGCRDNFYNGNNPLGVKKCWCFKTSKIVKKKFVPIWQRPPWDMPAQKTLSCHNKPGYVKVDPEVMHG